jgi:hypothetical protein
MIVACTRKLGQNYILLVCLLLSLPMQAEQAAASSEPSHAQELQAVCSELRQLRLAIERATSVHTRMEITLQRMQLQQGQVNRISAALESVHGEIARAEREQAQTASYLLDLESRLEREQDPTRQRQMREEQRHLKTVILEERSHALQDLRSREAEMTSSLQNEQTKLNDLYQVAFKKSQMPLMRLAL